MESEDQTRSVVKDVQLKEQSLGDRAMAGLARADRAIQESPVTELASRYTNGLSFGAKNVISDAIGMDSPQQRADFDDESPLLGTTAELAGMFTPKGMASRIAGAVGQGVKGAIGAAERASPLVRALRARAGAVTGGPVIGRSAQAGATGALLGAAQGAISGQGDLKERVSSTFDGAETGATFGSALGGASRMAKGISDGLRKGSPDIQLLEKWGMEPGTLRPVVKEGATLREQLKPSPTGISTVGSKERSLAGLDSAKPLVGDINARGKINEDEFGRQYKANRRGEGREWLDYADEKKLIKKAMERGDLPDGTRSKLSTVLRRMHHFAFPKIKREWKDMGDGIQVPVRTKLKPAPDAKIRASKKREIRDRVDNEWTRDENIDQASTPSKQAFGDLRHIMQNSLPPGMQALDTKYSEALSRLERAKEGLGLKETSKADPNKLSTIEKAGRTLTAAGEDTKFAGPSWKRTERLRTEGPPRLLEEHLKPPPFVDYDKHIEWPRVLAAQERLQLNPSALWSGAGASRWGSPARLLINPLKRAAYPALKNFGKADVGVATLASDKVVSTMRKREALRKKEEEEALAAQAEAMMRDLAEENRKKNEAEDEAARQRNYGDNE